MSVPGLNLLAVALRAIAPDTVTFHKFAGVVEKATGYDVPQFDLPVDIINTSCQPVDRERYGDLGFDFAKEYVEWFVSGDVIDWARGYDGDEITWNSARWKLVSIENWLQQDGWKCARAVKISNA